ncbi:hypothetical protein [Pseudomonas sp. SLFW]|uniref:hypothetical protein n=1 Tax=Pseudomonas sp. SLFW TaxID=2683259 RepID=UPI0021157384|nr:hypothetical protein [Pseudomonas sp. SLFW]
MATALRNQIFRSRARALINEKMGSAFETSALGIDGRRVGFEPIDRAAITACEHWEGSTYPWELVSGWKKSDAKGFDLAIWYDQTLCGLCYATPRQSRLTIKIILLEGNPGASIRSKGLLHLSP